MTEPIRAPEDTLPTPPAAGDALIAGAIAATVDSAEPMPAAETAQAPRMFGDLASPFVLVLGLGESGLAMAGGGG
ncbi:UDP-N-acetylmuramoyl-L-alanine--D-glutamate ligase, partial [Ralstonia solanacearum]|nr:UDP-N-acetylmuramoyl-L-alanine--D-glutamate ligase [Ralstonia pseudosolanacearum]